MAFDSGLRVCPVEIAGILDNKIRKWLQEPQKILASFVKEGMTVLDVGCGPGFFSLPMAQMVGNSGRVIAADLQEGMLQKIRDKIKGIELEARITLHKCEENKIGVTNQVDFVLLFFMVHEVQDKAAFFSEILTMLKPTGQVLMVEPPIHVSKAALKKTVQIAKDAGFTTDTEPKVRLCKAVMLKKE